MTDKRTKWRRWLQRIADDTDRLIRWQKTFETADDQPVTGEFARFVGQVYAHAMTIGIRRQLKLGSRNISLAGLLEDIAANAPVLRLHATTVREDLAELRRSARAAEAFADRVVAHTDRRSGRPPATEDVGRAIAVLEHLRRKYAMLIEGQPSAVAPSRHTREV